MAFKDILLTLTSYHDPTPVSAVQDAVSVAAAFGANLAAISCEVHVEVPGHFLPGSIANLPGVLAGEAERSRKNAKDLLAVFVASADKAGVPHEIFLEKCPTYKLPDLLIDYARLRDLTIMPVPESYGQWYAEAMIFGSGRPTLILPAAAHPRPFELSTVAVAWDFSRRRTRGFRLAAFAGESEERPRRHRDQRKGSGHRAFRRRIGEEPGPSRHRCCTGQSRRQRQADRRGARRLRPFARRRPACDGCLRPLQVARVHSWRRDQEPAVKAAASNSVFALMTGYDFASEGSCKPRVSRAAEQVMETISMLPTRKVERALDPNH